MKSWLEACCSTGWNGCDLTTDGAGEGELSLLVSNDQLYKTLLAVDMEALEYFWVSVGIKTNSSSSTEKATNLRLHQE